MARASALGAEGRRFKSDHPDQLSTEQGFGPPVHSRPTHAKGRPVFARGCDVGARGLKQWTSKRLSGCV